MSLYFWNITGEYCWAHKMFDSYTALGILKPSQDAIHQRRATTKVSGKAKHVDLQNGTKPSEQAGEHIIDPCKMTAPWSKSRWQKWRKTPQRINMHQAYHQFRTDSFKWCNATDKAQDRKWSMATIHQNNPCSDPEKLPTIKEGVQRVQSPNTHCEWHLTLHESSIQAKPYYAIKRKTYKRNKQFSDSMIVMPVAVAKLHWYKWWCWQSWLKLAGNLDKIDAKTCHVVHAKLLGSFGLHIYGQGAHPKP